MISKSECFEIRNFQYSSFLHTEDTPWIWQKLSTFFFYKLSFILKITLFIIQLYVCTLRSFRMYLLYENISTSFCLSNLITKFNNRFTIRLALKFSTNKRQLPQKWGSRKKVILFQCGFNKATFFPQIETNLLFLQGQLIFTYSFFVFVFFRALFIPMPFFPSGWYS